MIHPDDTATSAAPTSGPGIVFDASAGSGVAGEQLRLDGGLLREERFALPTCSVFRQTRSMEPEIDCKLQSNSR
jgi:hypothetical protein